MDFSGTQKFDQEKTRVYHTMGQEIVSFDDDCDDSIQIASVSQLLRQTRGMSPANLKLYFEALFARMTTGSKEAVTEILWTGLNPAEQQSFEMPYFGQRYLFTLYNTIRF